jgi:hypothetical protein
LTYIFSIRNDGGRHERTQFEEAWHCDYVVARRKRSNCFLDEIDGLIDWKPFDNLLRKKLKRVVNAFFRARYLGTAKVELEFFLDSIAFNLKKAVVLAG